MFAAKELAPTEDQGVIFGIITAPANATIDDTIRYADAAGKVFTTFPTRASPFNSRFPDSGFGGMVLKPWGVRKTPTKAYLPQVQMKLGAIPGIQMFPVMPSALPGGDNFPVSFVIASTADPERILEFAKQISDEGDAGGMFFNLPTSTPRSTSRRPRSFSITTRSRRWASTCSRSAPISPPASAAISSIVSTSPAAVTRSSRRSSGPNG